MNIIETRNLTKVFPARRGNERKAQAVAAVKELNLEVPEGEIFGFLGPNGAGKTTTLRMLATLLPPTSGEACIAGYDLVQEAAQVRRHIGYVSQAGGVDATATARENLLLQAQLYGMSRRDAESRVKELITAFELDSFAGRVASTYSGGQRRRLDLALGLVHRPKLLFLDEPTTGLDPQSRSRLWEEVRNLKGNGTTIFLTTHYLEEADALADRLAIIDGGTIVAQGTSQSLKEQIAGDVVTLGLESSNGQLAQAQNLLQAQPFVRELHPAADQLQLYVERGDESLPAILRTLDEAGLTVRRVTPASRLVLILGMVLQDVLVFLLQSATLIVLALLMGLRPDWTGIPLLIGLLVLVGLTMVSFSYGMTMTLPEQGALAGIISTFTVPLLLLSGVLLPMTLAPDLLQTVAAINPFTHAVDATRALVNGHVGDPSVVRSLAIFSGLAVLALFWATRVFRRSTA